MLTNNNFANYFSQDIIKNCDLIILSQGVSSHGSYTIASKDDIISFSMSRVNLGVLENIPVDRTTFKIWWRQVAHNEFEKGKIIRIMPVVEGYSTDDAIIQVIDDVKVDYYGMYAVVTCSSPITLLNTNTINGVALAGDLQTYPANISKAEDLQHTSISYGYGKRMKPYTRAEEIDANNLDIETDLILDNDVIKGFFNIKNIYREGINSYYDDPDKTNILAYGLNNEADEVLISEKETGLPTIYFRLTEQFIVTRAECDVYNQGQWQPHTATISEPKYSNTILVSSTYGYSQYKFRLYGYRANVNIPNNVAVAVKTYIWLNNQTDKIKRVQDVARYYYKHNKYIEFDCRLDPRFEPQDVIYIPTLGTLRLEEVTTNFNGGYKGHIKARIIDEGIHVARPIVNITSYGPDNFSFTITNPNTIADCRVYIKYSNNKTLSFQLNAGATMTFNNSNASGLYDSFVEYNDDNLTDDVYCYFDMFIEGTPTSENTFILEANAL